MNGLADTDQVALSIRDVAARFGVSYNTVHRMIERGELRPIKLGRCTRIPTAQIDAILASSPAPAAHVGTAG